MKKLFLSIILMAFMASASAQFAVSAHLGGSYLTGGSTFKATHYGVSSTLTDSIYDVPMDPINNDIPLNLSGGLKIGYQIGRLQMGISGSFSYSHIKGDFTPADYNKHNFNLKPTDRLNTTWTFDELEGWYSVTQTSFKIAPYVRYEVIQLGDVAFFLELDAFYTKANKPKRHEYLDFYHMEMHHTIDKDSTILCDVSALGAEIIPGLSWQLAEHCNIELYFDLLALAFTRTTETVVSVKDEYMTTPPYVLSLRTTTTNTTTTNNIGFGTNGVPALSASSRNWVRIGFNYTF